MDKLTLFWMLCFPEEYIVGVVIPEMKKHLTTKVTLQEFHVWLGCYFFWQMWWSLAPISMFEGAPFQLNRYILCNWFFEIAYYTWYTLKEEPLLLR